MAQKNPLGNFKDYPKEIILLWMQYLSSKDFLTLRLLSTAFRDLVDSKHIRWEPEDLGEILSLPFALGKPKKGDYYRAGQMGEYRWPGETTLLLCRDTDHVIEVRDVKFSYKKDQKKFTLDNNNLLCELEAHKSPISKITQLGPTLFASGDEAGKVVIWERNNKRFEPTELSEHKTKITDIMRLKDRIVFTADESGVVKKWNLNLEDALKPIKTVQFELQIVSLDRISDEELQVSCINRDEKKYPLIFCSMDLEVLETKPQQKLRFGNMQSKYEFSDLFVFKNRHICSVRFFTYKTEVGNKHNVYATNNVLDEKGKEISQITNRVGFCDVNEKWEGERVSVLANSNFLIWNQAGEACLAFPRRNAQTFQKGRVLPKYLEDVYKQHGLTLDGKPCDTTEDSSSEDCNEDNLVY